MSDPLNERLNKILPRVISDEFLLPMASVKDIPMIPGGVVRQIPNRVLRRPGGCGVQGPWRSVSES